VNRPAASGGVTNGPAALTNLSTPPGGRSSLQAMLEAESVAVVGASARPDSFGDRVLTELSRSRRTPEIHLVNPKYSEIAGLPCSASLADIGESVDLVLFCVGDSSLAAQVELAAARGDRSGIVFGNVVSEDGSLRRHIAETARGAGMELCGGGCMGFVNRVYGLRAIGYLEPSPLPAGPIALVTHSGSAFSALLRADRRLGWTLAVSSGQELVTTTASYLDYALSLPETEVVGLLLETLRSPETLRASLSRCAEAGIPVVALTVGGSPGGRAMVAAHSGALAGDDATWEALCDAHGVLRVHDLDEMADTLELMAAGRRVLARPGAGDPRPGGIASVHDSGAERALVADVAHAVGVGFAEISEATHGALAAMLDRGLVPGNPLDVWGTGAGTRDLFGNCLLVLAEDEAVDVVALCVDLIPELDGDTAYPEALVDSWNLTEKPLCLLSNVPSALDRPAARRLRDAGIPVLEGTRSGLLALGHLLAFSESQRRVAVDPVVVDVARRRRWLARLSAAEPLTGAESLALLEDYGLAVPAFAGVVAVEEAVAAAERIGFPVVLKTDDPAVAHMSDVGGVVLGLGSPGEVARAYADLADRLGRRALVMATAPAGTELALGIVSDALLGPVVVVGAGGVLVELLADRAVGLPPLDHPSAHRLLDRLAVRPVLDGVRGAPAADVGAVASAVVALSTLVAELGDVVEALDVNPLSCGPTGALALDALVVGR
jgi:acyl-CoA synthetase (NDP forming)